MMFLPIVVSLALYHLATAAVIPRDSSNPVRKYNLVKKYSGSLESRDSCSTEIPASLFGIWYVIPVSVGVGNEATEFNMLFDTGSPDFWVSSIFLPPNEDGNHTLYNPNGAVQLDATWNITYGGGTSSASGIVFEDTIDIGGIVIQNQAVEAATQLTTNNVGEPFDGILGLSLSPSTITVPVNTTLFNLLSLPLQLPVFTVALFRPSEPEPGFFTFGEVDQQLIGDQSVEFTDVIPLSQDNPGGFWLFSSSYATIDGVVYPRAGNLAFADTGTPVIYISNSTLAVIYGLMGGIFVQDPTFPYGAAWIYPETASVPTITLPIGNVEITLGQNDINGGPVSNGYVYGTLQPRELQPGLEWDIFGDVWLWNVYTIFEFGDLNAPTMGAVQRVPS